MNLADIKHKTMRSPMAVTPGEVRLLIARLELAENCLRRWKHRSDLIHKLSNPTSTYFKKWEKK